MPKIIRRYLHSKEIRKNQVAEDFKVSYSITIDKDIAEALNLKNGDIFYWNIIDKRKGKRELILKEI